jgi:transposase-like protein
LALYPKQTKEDEKPLTLSKLALQYADEDESRKYFESLRWPDGVTCPHCQSKEHYALKPNTEPRQRGKRPARNGLYKCKDCSKQFTVTVGTIFADSKIQMSKWCMAIFLICSSKKAISAHQLHRTIGVTYKTAWFMSHRIRHAFAPLIPADKLSGSVEVDEMYSGTKNQPKLQVVALVERGGDVRTKIVTRISHRNIGQFLRDNVARGSVLQTDGHAVYKSAYLPAIRHDSVNHGAKEFIRERADGTKVHVNHCESFFSLFRRGVMGAFHHISNQHLHRYANEFAFRWNTRKLTDGQRFLIAIQESIGKRLKYKNTIAA